MLPWELNGWLQYGDGKFMYFQTGGWCSMLLGVWDIPGHWGHLIWWRHRVWVAPGQGGPLGNYLSSLYCQIIDSIREIGATSPSHLGWTRDIPGQMRLLSGNISHPSEPEPCALCVLRTIVCRVSHEARGQKHTLESGAGALWQGRSLSNEQREGWEGSALSTCHNLNSNLAMKSLKWIRVIFNSYQQSCHLPLSN